MPQVFKRWFLIWRNKDFQIGVFRFWRIFFPQKTRKFVTERLFWFSKYFPQNGEKIKSWALPTLLGHCLCLSCALELELFACVCLMLLLLRVFAIISSSPLFLGRSCVPLLLCRFVTRRRSSPLHKVRCCVFFPIQLCIHSLYMSFGSLAWRHCLVRVCIWIAFTQFQNHCPSFDALTLESLIANAEDLIDLRCDTISRVVEQSEFFDRFFFL